jgi:hypothetical protein
VKALPVPTSRAVGPLRSIEQSVWLVRQPKSPHLPLMELPCSAESCSVGRTGYSVPRSPYGVAIKLTLGVFRPSPSPEAFTRLGFILSRASSLLQRPSRTLPSHFHRSKLRRRFMGSSHEVLRPFSVQTRRVGKCSGSTRNAIPPRPFSDPRGFDPHRASWPCSMPQTLMGFPLLRAFPYHGPPPNSSPEDSLSTFARSFRRIPGRAPRALHPAAIRSLSWGIAPAIDPMPSRAFNPPLRHLASRLGARILKVALSATNSSAPDLPTKPFKLVPIVGLQRIPVGAPDNPLSRETNRYDVCEPSHARSEELE